MLKSEIIGRDPATFLNYVDWLVYKDKWEGKNLVGIANFGPYPLFFLDHFAIQ